MSVEVIPAGSSVVVTEHDKSWAKDAERVKDVLAVMASTEALQFANVERSIANHFENTIQDVKDAESRLMKDSGDKFIQTIQDIKDAAKDAALASAKVDANIAAAASNAALASANTDHNVAVGFGHVNERLQDTARDIEKVAYQNQMATMLAFKDQALLSERLAAHQALLSEQLAAKAAAQLCECCCEIKEAVDSVKEDAKSREIAQLREQLTEAKLLGRRFRTFSPVLPGTLRASDED